MKTDREVIAYFESSLPARCKFWLSDAQANGEDVGDVGGELIDALTGQFRWHASVARVTVNTLLGAYGSAQRFIPTTTNITMNTPNTRDSAAVAASSAHHFGSFPLTVQITGTSKPWVIRITERHLVYGFSGEFLPIATSNSRRCNTLEIKEEGYYKVPTPNDAKVVAGSRRIDTGYIHISADGAMTEIAASQVVISPSDFTMN